MTPAPAIAACRVRACAKVNLDLRVLGVRPDGYHHLATVFQSIDLADELHIEILPRQGVRPGAHAGPSISCTDPRVPCDDRNLVWRAAELLCRRLDIEVPTLHVSIEKRIPPEAGLGGGSADAAAMLLGLNAMLGAPATVERLVDVAAALGADVPFMLMGGTALGTGRGDVLHSLPDLPPHEVVIVHPGFGVPTADAYRWFDAAGGGQGITPAWPVAASEWTWALDACRNDLQPPVFSRHPELARVVETLRRDGARLAAMTGSGSALFGLFAPGGKAGEAARGLARPGRFVAMSRTVGRTDFDQLTRPVLAAGLR